jgi:outer membrane protein assembly factor BamB
VLAGTATELIALATDDGRVRWRAKRPVAFAFATDGATLLTISGKGVITTIDPATGTQAATLASEVKREVVRASLHPESGLAVLGVADG